MGGYPPPDDCGGGAVFDGTPSHARAYRFHVQEGDRVRLPDGREGTVYMVEIKHGHFKVVSIRPDKPKRRLFGLLPPIPLRFADEEIDQMILLPSEEEIRRIMDDPVELGLDP
ncbi:MAG: hypothetical protein AAB554_03315 [Patescibacteria group bacterium]